MNTYLLKWNPDKWPWLSLEQDIDQLRRKGFFDDRWSCGTTKRIQRRDLVFLMRVGVEPKGIMGSGVVMSEPYRAEHFERKGQTALYVDVRFDTLVHPEKSGLLEIKQLPKGPLADFFERTKGVRSSGTQIPPDVADELEAVWLTFLNTMGHRPAPLAEEVTAPARFFEGATQRIYVNAFERNPHARQQCIQHHGCRCSVCGFDFEAKYGELGRGYIHVHHLTPLAEIRKEYEINPIADLRPICPNCHAMIHRGPETLSIEELQKIIQKASSGC